MAWARQRLLCAVVTGAWAKDAREDARERSRGARPARFGNAPDTSHHVARPQKALDSRAPRMHQEWPHDPCHIGAHPKHGNPALGESHLDGAGQERFGPKAFLGRARPTGRRSRNPDAAPPLRGPNGETQPPPNDSTPVFTSARTRRSRQKRPHGGRAEVEAGGVARGGGGIAGDEVCGVQLHVWGWVAVPFGSPVRGCAWPASSAPFEDCT